MSTFTAICLTVNALCVLVILRSRLVLRVHLRRIATIRDELDAAMEDGTFEMSMLARYHTDVGSYNLHLLDLTKWTYRQFYPQRKLAQ